MKAHLGSIVKNTPLDMFVFKIGFKTTEEAKKYKDMFSWILKDDGYKVDTNRGNVERNKEKK